MLAQYQTHFITRDEARDISRDLKGLGYKTTIADCREQVPNVVRRLAGADPDARREVESVIERTLDWYWDQRNPTKESRWLKWQRGQ